MSSWRSSSLSFKYFPCPFPNTFINWFDVLGVFLSWPEGGDGELNGRILQDRFCKSTIFNLTIDIFEIFNHILIDWESFCKSTIFTHTMMWFSPLMKTYSIILRLIEKVLRLQMIVVLLQGVAVSKEGNLRQPREHLQLHVRQRSFRIFF